MSSTTLAVRPTGVERVLADDQLIVSKTDLKGRLTYTNDVFLTISAIEEQDAIGRPHNLIRHPSMPRGIFRLLWDTLRAGDELFAYVQNLALDGAHYWVFAHVTPSRDAQGRVVGYHSTRRAVSARARAEVERLYGQMLQVEAQHPGRGADEASLTWLQDRLTEQGQTYSEWLWSVAGGAR
ncbi:PAS domain-containing protein [Sanguibacter sp. 4.1]|uniref:PAS domain-containing protein n=1 Tax=Sanguibacter biliveldensis TaxID=3030830 RepID=A0AAF1C3I6_9MICO|nr:PAS domain-containing protein [Sanguibacter sp. 4.1]WPF82909.1 PAS domain-containing protein [Sanguibacter sp. 4.1]